MIRLIQTIYTLLEQGENLVVATILSHAGSTPRTAGTKMIVRQDGDSIATVGGGLVEGEVIKAAEEVFRGQTGQIRTFDLTGAAVESMDLVCGGSLEILVEFMEATTGNARVFQELASSLRRGERGYLVADLGAGGPSGVRVKRCMITEGGERHGDLYPPEELLAALSSRRNKERYPVLLDLEQRRFLIEPSFPLGTVHLFGAGHVSQQVAPLAKLVDFRVVVMDDRGEFANRDRFPHADTVSVVESFEESFQGLEIDDDSYVVIVTRGHLHDKTVLEQALRTDARYVGMIGSRKKRDTIFAQLKDAGFTDDDLARVHSPIGLDILAETPEEIGVSIIGELIRSRAHRDAQRSPEG